MRNNFSKSLLLIVIVGGVLASILLHPSFFVSGNTSTANAGGVLNATSGTSRAGGDPPMLVLPTLTADSDTQNATSVTIASETPNLGAEVEFIADLQSGKQYLNVNGSERWPMASISKLMTAVIATDVLDPNDRVTITASMTAVDPTEHILNIGDTYTVADLLHVMLLPSNNVAAEALAEFYGRRQFLAAMNAKAQAWGMTGTYYYDPSGLSAANESSANDLLKLTQHIYTDYPQVFAITRMSQATVFNDATNRQVIVTSINQFAGDADFDGGKTGYTDQADGNLLSIFQYDGRPVFVLVLGIDDGVRFDATQELYNWFKQNFS